MPLGTPKHQHAFSPIACWEPNPTWTVEPSEYRIDLELPPNSAPLESLNVVVTQYRRVNHDEIRVSIMKDCERVLLFLHEKLGGSDSSMMSPPTVYLGHYLWSMYFPRGEIDPSEEALKANLETGKLVIKISRL